jgi:monofunctional biosynthetic peptidoglycan transglycosylase
VTKNRKHHLKVAKAKIFHRPVFVISGLILGLIALGISYSVFMVNSWVKKLQTHYPIVRYQGMRQPVLIEFQKHPPKSWTRLNQISSAAIQAVIVSEDWAFYQHQGFDLNQISEAIKKDLEKAKFARGASTITQQMVKNVFLSNEKSLWRKIKESVLTLQVERVLNKKKILEVYFNIAEWDGGIYGIGAASWHYFQKPPSQLSAKEGAFLAMLLPSPKRYSQSFRNRKLTQYATETIESRWSKLGI